MVLSFNLGNPFNSIILFWSCILNLPPFTLILIKYYKSIFLSQCVLQINVKKKIKTLQNMYLHSSE